MATQANVQEAAPIEHAQLRRKLSGSRPQPRPKRERGFEREDRMIAPDNERRMAARIGAKTIVTLVAGRASLAPRPNEVSALVDDAAKAAGR
jgi:hypothetical protein